MLRAGKYTSAKVCEHVQGCFLVLDWECWEAAEEVLGCPGPLLGKNTAVLTLPRDWRQLIPAQVGPDSSLCWSNTQLQDKN